MDEIDEQIMKFHESSLREEGMARKVYFVLRFLLRAAGCIFSLALWFVMFFVMLSLFLYVMGIAK